MHGDLEGLKEILLHAKLIDSCGSWIGEKDTLIQIGEVVDWGHYSLESLELLKKLQLDAPASGGRVIRLCGNHEIWLVAGFGFDKNLRSSKKIINHLKREISNGRIVASWSDGIWLYTYTGVRAKLRKTIEKEILSERRGVGMKWISLELFSDHINRRIMDFI